MSGIYVTVQQLRESMYEDGVLVVGRNDQVIEQHISDVPWLADIWVSKVNGFATADHVAGKHVFGVLPMQLEAQARTVTRYDVRANTDQRISKEAADNQYTSEQIRSMSRELVTYQVTESPLDVERVISHSPLFVTRHMEQIADWRERGLLRKEQHVVVICEDGAAAAAMSDSISEDERGQFTVLHYDVGDCGSSVYPDLPPGLDYSIVHAHVPEDQRTLVEGRSVVGILPPHLKDAAHEVTTFEYDRDTGTYGSGATYHATVISRTLIYDSE